MKVVIGHICDSGYLCIYYDIYFMYSAVFVAWRIVPLVTFAAFLISGVGVKTATDILCESDSCHNKQ